MSKSIETMWKEGFIDEGALVVPKVNDLYNQKSQNIVDKLTVMFEWNLKGIIIGTAIILAGMVACGLPYLGMFISALLIFLVIKGYQFFAELKQIDKNVNSYQYIKSFDSWMKKVMVEYASMYRFIYPMIFMACMIRFGLSEVGQSIIVGVAQDFPSIPVVFGVPIIISGVILLIAFLLSYFSAAIYRFDIRSLYGRQLDKLDEIVADMESLQTQQDK
ncbi:hypothetical protein [Psychrobium sp. 1_MG-2023]|uniref:hypothetical protein n=1 Tax=Psychrobium sp. 1_MG-2023 TaxID=3062624 RepID=UPI000C34D048|nr:hypothetical protein [Psychrobium sp. 1_MG-2023]MDP2562814.1 hypothetical protein [Psychrobium sp. 1_MG-2023]PKF54437.1 hypothetical protein CW748_15820 [Alteromonadales bacterium alter-6D02]